VRPGLAGAPALAELRQLAAAPGAPRRFAPNQLRHAHAVGLARESVAVNIIQLQVGHTDLGTASAYLQGIDPSEIVDTVRFRRPPTMSATAGLALWQQHAATRSRSCAAHRASGRALGLACARAAARLDGAVSSGLARTREVAAVTG
jgi:hypothetical protein